MNKLVSAIIVVIIVAAGAWFIFGRSDNNSSSSKTTGTSTSENHSSGNQNSQGNSVQPVATDSVKIMNFAFSPADITVKKGTKVTWTNNDSTTHTVTENDGKNGPSAPEMAPGSSYSFTYSETGTFRYHCTIHPDMIGTVTVTE